MVLSHGFQELDQFYASGLEGALDQSIPLVASAPVSGESLFSAFTASCKHCPDPRGWNVFAEDGFTLNPCFVEALVLNIPNLLLLTLGIYQVFRLTRSGDYARLRVDWRLPVKGILIIAQMIFFLLAAYAQWTKNSFDNVFVFTPLLSVVSLFVALSLHYVETFRSTFPNGVLLFYWLLSLISLVCFKVVSLNMDGYFHTWKAYSVPYIFATINAALVLGIEWLIPPPRRIMLTENDVLDDENSPEEEADIFSRLCFNWMTPLMKLGYKTFLTEKDLPPLPHEERATLTTSTFEKAWQNQIENAKHPSLLKALVKAFGGPFIVGGLFKAVQDVLSFAQPQVLRILIKFVNDYYEGKDVPLRKGFLIASVMFAISVVQTITLHQYFQRAFGTGMKIKSSLTAEVFKKSLVLSSEDRSQRSTGDIVNLMSIDTQRLQDLCQYGQTIWSGPFQIILCLASLYNLLGNSMWAGVFIMIILIPANSYLTNKQKLFQKAQMNNKDQRTRLTTELLTNIKSLKLYGWENAFVSKLSHIRNDLELVTLKNIGTYTAASVFLWQTAPFFVSCSTFALFVFTQDRPLTSDIVFPALTLFNLLSFPLGVIPMVISASVEASVALQRLTGFLTAAEIQPDAVERQPSVKEVGEEAVTVTNGTFLWSRKPEYKIALADVNFTARKGELACIVGRVGSGKSSMLQAILGDLYKSEGHVVVKGSVAYVAQVPWIMNATVKENILFGCRYDPEFYHATISACALEDDFAVLPEGDSTQVGEKGIALSGGQKARLSLARAVYARADVYLLDDPLSAVDEHVGRHIIDNVLGPDGLLSSKAIILATNSIPVLHVAQSIAMISNGRIVESGNLPEILESNGMISQLVTDFGKRKVNSSSTTSTLAGNTDSDSGKLEDTASTSNTDDNEEEPVAIVSDKAFEKRQKRRRSSAHLYHRASVASLKKPSVEDDDARPNKETMVQGKVQWDVYTEYAKASNIYAVIAFVLLLLLSTGLSVLANVWLKHWADINSRFGANPHISRYLGFYIFLGVGAAVVTVSQSLVLYTYCAIHSARILHDRMLNAVVRAPMSFFETTPLGRILNRFSNDVYRIDQVLARTFSQFFINTTKVFYTMVVISFATPLFVLFIVPLFALYLWYQRYYLRTSRELKRLDSVSKSPIYAHFQETLGGISTVRAYNQQYRFEFINEGRIDLNMKAYYPTVCANRWLAVRLEFIGSVIILSAASLGVASLPTGRITAGVIGLTMSYALQITQSLNWIVRMTVEVETNIVSVERILEYADIPSEAPTIITECRPPTDWPEVGEVRFKDYSTKYRPELPLVLNHINLDVKPQEKIGIVGRTGAGKSSLTLALFRIIEPTSGYISIDNVNTSTIGLYDLRHSLSIIPQDSQAFEGTVRENLDPEGLYTDDAMWRALELSHLKDHVISMGNGLDCKIQEGGSNLSVGQRQLLCLARVLLAPSKVLVLDEATAAVDVETDVVLQDTIRTEFRDRTILTIAHRLNTIMDSDRIIVLSAGKIAEFDKPSVLLQNKNSLFYSLCKQGGFVNDD